jgi:biotin-(acetyl-CoA carboxylase) ligase
MLIEMEGDFLLVGIGCNVMTAPEVATTGIDGGRPPTCIREHNPEIDTVWREYQEGLENGQGDNKMKEEFEVQKPENFSLNPKIGKADFHKKLTIEIVNRFYEWMKKEKEDNNSYVIEEFTRRMDFSPQRRRDLEEGKNVVIPLGLNSDGTLQVTNRLCPLLI